MRYNGMRVRGRLLVVVVPTVDPYAFRSSRSFGSSSHPTTERIFRPGQTERTQVRYNHQGASSLAVPGAANYSGRRRAKIIGGGTAAGVFQQPRIEIQIRSEWNLGVLSFRPTLKCFWLERS